MEKDDSDVKDALKKARVALRQSRRAETLFEIFNPEKQHKKNNERKYDDGKISTQRFQDNFADRQCETPRTML